MQSTGNTPVVDIRLDSKFPTMFSQESARARSSWFANLGTVLNILVAYRIGKTLRNWAACGEELRSGLSAVSSADNQIDNQWRSSAGRHTACLCLLIGKAGILFVLPVAGVTSDLDPLDSYSSHSITRSTGTIEVQADAHKHSTLHRADSPPQDGLKPLNN